MIFLGVILVGIIVGVILMLTNNPLFNEVTSLGK